MCKFINCVLVTNQLYFQHEFYLSQNKQSLKLQNYYYNFSTYI